MTTGSKTLDSRVIEPVIGRRTAEEMHAAMLDAPEQLSMPVPIASSWSLDINGILKAGAQAFGAVMAMKQLQRAPDRRERRSRANDRGRSRRRARKEAEA